MTTINEYLNRDKEEETKPIKSLEDAKKAFPAIKVWVESEEELLKAIGEVE